jgi:hypothetical protein
MLVKANEKNQKAIFSSSEPLWKEARQLFSE